MRFGRDSVPQMANIMKLPEICAVRKLCFVALLLFIFACSAQAQIASRMSGEARVQGYVREERSQQALPNVHVEISASGGQAPPASITGLDGQFRFSGIQDGEYDIVVNEKGYEPYRERIFLANGNQVIMTVNLKKSSPESEGKAEVLSAHELTVPQKARDSYEKGMTLKAKPDYAGALAQFQKAIQQFPTYYEAFAEAGVAEVNLNQLDAAEKDLQKSIDLSEGKYSPSLFYMAGLLNNKRQYDDAASMARKGLALDENAWRGQFEMARALTGLKRGDEAVPYAKKAVEMAPSNPQMYVALMNADLRAGDYPGALGAIDSFLKLSGTGPQADQVRRLREQVEAEIQKSQSKAAPATPTPAPK
jgi:tetratricopeptide (TPR) repeat protein